MGLRRIDLTAQVEPIRWAWEGLLPKGFVSMVGALPGEGKTVLLTALAWQATRPQGELLGRAVEPGPVVYLDFDAATGDGRATRRWLEAHQAAFPDGDMGKIVLLEPDGDTYGLGEKEMEELEGVVREVGGGLVILDSFMAAFPLDPVKLHQVQSAMWWLRRLALRTGAAVAVVDHLPKPVGGERAGARGLLGSIAKTAQARAVHILTRVPPAEVQGRHVLKWEVLKSSFAPIPEPFGVELIFSLGRVEVAETPLPEGTANPKRDKARQAMLELLNAQAGSLVPKAELVQAAVEAANIARKTAERYLKELAEELALEKVHLPGQGGPVAYRLRDASLYGEDVPKPQESPSSSQKVLEHPPVPKPSPVPKPDPRVELEVEL